MFLFLRLRHHPRFTRTDTLFPNTTRCRALELGGAVVGEPARGEQGRGFAVDLETMESVETSITNASAHSDLVIVESFHNGDDLRLIVIAYKLVAAAIRRPAEVVEIGRASCRERVCRDV